MNLSIPATPMTDNILKKPSTLIRLERRLTLVQQQVWNVLLAETMANLTNEREYRIAVNVLSDLVKAASNRSYFESSIGQLKNIALGSEAFEDQRSYPSYPLLTTIRFTAGYCYFNLSNEIKQIIRNETHFCEIDLTLQRQYKGGKYGWFLYEWCLDEVSRSRTNTVSLKGFRRYLGIHDRVYSSFKDLNKRVIQPAVVDINSQTDLEIKVNFKRKDRKIDTITLFYNPITPVSVGTTSRYGKRLIKENTTVLFTNSQPGSSVSTENSIKKQTTKRSRKRLFDIIMSRLNAKSDSYPQLTPYYQAKIKREIFYNYISSDAKQSTLLADVLELSDIYLKTQWSEFQSYLVDKREEEKQSVSDSQTEHFVQSDLSDHNKSRSDIIMKTARDRASERNTSEKRQSEHDIRAIGLASYQSEKQFEEDQTRETSVARETMTETDKTEIDKLKSLLS